MTDLKDAASSAVIWGTSISARSGSPNADKTVMRPNASAKAEDAGSPKSATTNEATAVLRQPCDLEINLLASDARAHHYTRELWT